MVLLTLAVSLDAPEISEEEIDRLVADLERAIIEHGQ
jgi:hypothetical protein